MSYVVKLEYAYGVCPKCKNANYLRYLIHNDGLTHKPYEIKCTNCNSYFKKEDIFGSGEETEPKPATHYDLLIRKTPEELAEFIGDDPVHDICPNNCQEDLDRPCKVCVLDWLKQEAKNN